MHRISGLSLLGVLVLDLASCGGGGDGPSEPPPPAPVASVGVSPGTAALVVGGSQQLTAIPRDRDGKALTGRAVAWTTTEPMVAWVSTEGLATAEGEGSVTITATVDGVRGSATVSVSAAGPAGTPVTFASVAAGGAHTCGLTASGAAYCWGRGESGQLGVPPPTTTCVIDSAPLACSAFPVAVGGGLVFAQLTGGGAHTCGLTGDGSAWCWGSNSRGQLGDNSTTSRNAPVPVATDLRFASIDAGGQQTCGLTSGGIAYCWGHNSRGQLGDGTTENRSAPVPVMGGLTFQSIAAGGFVGGFGLGHDHTCALTSSGEAYCWGDNEPGQLGRGTFGVTAHPLPVSVSTTLRFSALTAGLGRHTCALTSAGAAYCWGQNSFGALGNGSTVESAVPVAVSGGLTFVRLIAGGFIGHTCGLTTTGAAYCWGDNERGQVGEGSTMDRSQPAAVAGGFTYVGLDAGYSHTCGRTITGTVYCWGAGAAGQLGTGLTRDRAVPGRVVGKP